MSAVSKEFSLRSDKLILSWLGIFSVPLKLAIFPIVTSP